MSTFDTMFGIMVMFAVLLVPGYVLGKLNLMYDAAGDCICNILMYVAMPSLVFSKLLTLDSAQIDVGALALSIIIPAVLAVVLLGACKLLCRGEVTQRRAMEFCAIFPNCGFLGIPLAGTMWPDKPQIVLYISIFNVVSTFLLLTLGVAVLSGDKSEIRLKKTLVSPIFAVIVLGIVCAALGIATKFPAISEYSATLAALTTPLSMTFLGFELSKLKLRKLSNFGATLAALLIKLILSPLVVLCGLLILKASGVAIETDFAYAMLVSSAVSTAASAPSMAKKYGADSECAATLTLLGTLLCVVTLPTMYLLYGFLFNI